MILITTTLANMPADFLLIAQNPNSYECLGFSDTGTAYNYDADHSEFEGHGRYLSRSGVLPATEAELRAQFFNIHCNRKIQEAKEYRNRSKLAPIELAGVGSFDMDEAAINNLNTAINYFTEVMISAQNNGWATVGTIPWVLADNTVAAVTQANLEEVAALAAARGMQRHLEYNVTKAFLEALRDSGGI